MVEIADIVDEESLRAWLEGQPKELTVWIAHRNAMRVIPVWWEYVLKSGDGKQGYLTALPVLRSNLISGAVWKIPSTEVKNVAFAAANASFMTPDDTAANAGDAATAAIFTSINLFALSNVSANAKLAANAVADIAYAAAVWNSIHADCHAIEQGADLDRLPLWGGQANPLAKTWAAVKQHLPTAHSDETARGADAIDWSFWIKWYDDALAGNAPNWKMLERIALIDPADWDKGAERVNDLIGEIVAEYDNKTNAPKEFQPTNVSPAAKTAIIERVQQNREVLALSIAGVLEQISEFSERIRGINHLDQAYRESLFEYLGGLSEQLTELLGQLPDDDQVIEKAQADSLVTWGQQFRHSFIVKAKDYAAPENVAGAVVPTGIILGCTAIGAIFGPMGAGAGAVIGKLVTGELKPAKAADALIENDDLPTNK